MRAGKIVIIDLSQGDPRLQRTYSDRLCVAIFRDGMTRFIENQNSNFIQMYFEEAHNLFPKKNESDLTLIYNRIAKEGAKLNLGLIYATQEVSSISANVLAPGLRVLPYRGADRNALLVDTRPGDLVVAGYGVVTRDADALANVRFATLLLDEAQAIKNAATRRAQAVGRLQADFRVALTGTPVENHLGRPSTSI